METLYIMLNYVAYLALAQSLVALAYLQSRNDIHSTIGAYINNENSGAN